MANPDYDYLSRVIPASSPEGADERLEALLAHRRALEERPHYRDYPSGGPGFLERMGPLMLSQGLDLLTTESALREPGTKEGNPIPGMQSFPGRALAQVLQTILFDQIYRMDPKIGQKGIDFGTILHSGAALGNEQTRADQKYLNLFR